MFPSYSRYLFIWYQGLIILSVADKTMIKLHTTEKCPIIEIVSFFFLSIFTSYKLRFCFIYTC